MAWITEKRLGKKTNLSPKTLQNQRLQGTSIFPYYKLGEGKKAPVRYDDDECDEIIRNQRHLSTSDTEK